MEQIWPTPTGTRPLRARVALCVLDTPLHVESANHESLLDRATDGVERFALLIRHGCASPELTDWARWIYFAPSSVIRHWLNRGLSGGTKSVEILEVAALRALDDNGLADIRSGLHRGGWPVWHAFADRLITHRREGGALAAALLDPSVVDARSFVASRASREGREDLVEWLARGFIEQHAHQIGGILGHIGVRPSGWILGPSGYVAIVVESVPGRNVSAVDLVDVQARSEGLLGFRVSIVTPGNLSASADWARDHKHSWTKET